MVFVYAQSEATINKVQYPRIKLKIAIRTHLRSNEQHNLCTYIPNYEIFCGLIPQKKSQCKVTTHSNLLLFTIRQTIVGKKVV